MRCNALQCVAVWHHVAVRKPHRCGFLREPITVYCNVLQCVAVWCSMLPFVSHIGMVFVGKPIIVRCSALQCVAVRCSALKCVAMCSGVV